MTEYRCGVEPLEDQRRWRAESRDDADLTRDQEAQQPVSGDVITLNAAIEKALANSLRLKLAGSAVLASKGEHLQAGLRPNPEASVEAENFAGRGALHGRGRRRD